MGLNHEEIQLNEYQKNYPRMHEKEQIFPLFVHSWLISALHYFSYG